MNRDQARHAAALERKALRSGHWGYWRHTPLPTGLLNTDGWCRDIRSSYANDLYAVLVRPMDTAWGLMHHCAIRTVSSLERPWRDKQRIKNELFGRNHTALEVMPPADELVDEADMYHMWIMPPGRHLPFSLNDQRHERQPA
jgi:hypothetical protein